MQCGLAIGNLAFSTLPVARRGEDDVFDELIDKAGAGTVDGIDKSRVNRNQPNV